MTTHEAASGHGQRAAGPGRGVVGLSVATEVKLPQLGQGMESGTIVRWLKAVGDPVKARDPLYELDTDKVTQEVEAEVDGVLLQILVPEGEVEVGRAIAVIGESGSEAPAEGGGVREPATPQAEVEPAQPTPAARVEPLPAAAAVTVGGRVKASPLARRIARERGVDLVSVAGTGPDGRILAEDVEQAAAGAAPAAPAPAPKAPAPAAAASAPAAVAPSDGEVEVVALSSTRRTIARRLTEAWTAPVFQLAVSVDATEVVALRERLVERLVERLADGEVTPTVNDVLVKLTATALVRHPALNALFANDEIHRYASANVGIAAAAPAGLVVPVIRGADRLTIQEIARARADVVGRAREGKLTLQDLEGGTFTISNLGMYGIEQFVAVLNPPQVAILAVGAVKDTPVVVEGEIDVAPMMTLTLTCDHRAIDGSEGAEFLRTLAALVEEPALAL
jgi:pyruvate dehydrogenase E2 component (dihydrolipoamide acetyltransferase)